MKRMNIAWFMFSALSLLAVLGQEPSPIGAEAKAPDSPAVATEKSKEKADLVITHDIKIGKPGGIAVTLDTAVRKDSAKGIPLPAILMIHGGGWKNGNGRASLGPILPNPGLYYAEHGYYVASVTYRLSGQAKWPAMIQDCKLAVRYLRAHAKDLNIDPNRIGTCGFSAGGHLAGCLGTMVDAPEMEGDGGYPGVSSRVQAVVMLSGPVDMSILFDHRGNGSKADDYKNEMFGPGWVEHPEILTKASSFTYVRPNAGLPPFWIGTSDKDQAVPPEQANILADALRKANVPYELVLQKNGGHGLGAIKDNVAKGIPDPDPSPETVKAMTLAFFDKYLKATPK